MLLVLAEMFLLQGVKIASLQLLFTWRNVMVLELLVLHDDLLVLYKVSIFSTFPHTFSHLLIILLPPATQVSEIGAAIKVTDSSSADEVQFLAKAAGFSKSPQVRAYNWAWCVECSIIAVQWKYIDVFLHFDLSIYGTLYLPFTFLHRIFAIYVLHVFIYWASPLARTRADNYCLVYKNCKIIVIG